MGIKITKMQGCGNDFVIIDYEEYKLGEEKNRWKNMSEAAKILCDRNFGAGADGFIIPYTNTENTDIGWFFYNSDGTTAQMCGNGIRCFAKYVFDKKLVDKKEFTVNTLAGIITPKILDDGQVRVNMSKPILEPEKIPFVPSNNIGYKISVKDKIFEGNAISMGNPHYVIFTEQDDDTMILAKEYGPIIEKSAEFPEKTNVEFAKIKAEDKIELSVWERGCGITLACGTGACATTVAAIINGLVEHSVNVKLPGGTVHIDWPGNKYDTAHDVYMTGPAQYVYTAELL
jgi:diaminopimelate epimerase